MRRGVCVVLVLIATLSGVVASGAHAATSGDLDTDFAVGGYVVFPDRQVPVDVEQLAAGGYALALVDSSEPPPPATVELRRLTADGDPDATFSGDGLVTFRFHPTKRTIVSRVLDGGAGRVVVAGVARAPGFADRVAIRRVSPTGTPDASFSGDGLVARTVPGALSVDVVDARVLTDGRLAAIVDVKTPLRTGAPKSRWMMRTHADGAPDLSLGPKGMRRVELVARGRAVLLPGGRYLRLEQKMWGSPYIVAVSKLLSNGRPDLKFSGDGSVWIRCAPNAAGTVSIAWFGVDDSRRVVLACHGDSPVHRSYLHRLTPFGALDGTFGTGGHAEQEGEHHVATDPSGRFVFARAVGTVGEGFPPSGIVYEIRRLDDSATPDASFSDDGVHEVELWYHAWSSLHAFDDRLFLYGFRNGPPTEYLAAIAS